MSVPDWYLSVYCRIRWYKVLLPPPLDEGHRDDRGPISLAGPGPQNTLRRHWFGPLGRLNMHVVPPIIRAPLILCARVCACRKHLTCATMREAIWAVADKWDILSVGLLTQRVLFAVCRHAPDSLSIPFAQHDLGPSSLAFYYIIYSAVRYL